MKNPIYFHKFLRFTGTKKVPSFDVILKCSDDFATPFQLWTEVLNVTGLKDSAKDAEWETPFDEKQYSSAKNYEYLHQVR
jgi:hypothetical protein